MRGLGLEGGEVGIEEFFRVGPAVLAGWLRRPTGVFVCGNEAWFGGWMKRWFLWYGMMRWLEGSVK